MATDLKSIRVFEFSGETSDWEGWSEKVFARGKWLCYKKLLLGRDNIPMETEYHQALTSNNKDCVKHLESNEQAYEYAIVSLNNTSNQGKKCI